MNFFQRPPQAGISDGVTVNSASALKNSGLVLNSNIASFSSRTYASGTGLHVLNNKGNLSKLEYTSSLSNFVFEKSWAVVNATWASSTSFLVMLFPDTRFDKPDGGSGGIDIYNNTCGLVKENATSLTFSGDIVTESDTGCDGEVNVIYPEPVFSGTFSVTPSLVYRGRIINDVQLIWTYSYNDIISQVLSGQGIPPQPNLNERSLSLSSLLLSNNSTWTLDATQKYGTIGLNTTLQFCNDVKTLRSANSTITALDIESLPDNLDCKFLGDYSTLDTISEPYWYLVYPENYGVVSKILDLENLFNVPFETSILSIQNSLGYSENYTIVRLLNETYSNIDIRVS